MQLKTQPTVADLARDHIAYARRQVTRGRMKPRTAAEIARLYRRTILPTLGEHELARLTEHEVEPWHADIAASAPVTANRAAAVLRAGWNLACRWRWVRPEDNPLRNLATFKAPERPRSRVLSHGEMTRLRTVLCRHLEVPELRRQAIAVLLLMLTGARHREILSLRRAWLQFDAETGAAAALLPDSKTGPKRIWLPREAVGLVLRLTPDTDTLFPGVSLRRYWARLVKFVGLEGATIHDLRRTFSTRLAEAGVPAEDVAALLGQKTVTVQVEVYRKISDARKVELANLAAAELAAERSSTV